MCLAEFESAFSLKGLSSLQWAQGPAQSLLGHLGPAVGAAELLQTLVSLESELNQM